VRPLLTIIFLALSVSTPLRALIADTLHANLLRVSEPFMISPHDMALTPDGTHLVVSDMGQDRVLLLDPDMLTIEGIVGEGILSLPHDVAFDGQGRLLVADSGNDRIAVFKRHGTQTHLIDQWGEFDGPEGLIPAPNGCLYIAETLADRVVCWKNGKIEYSIGTAFGMDLDQPHDVELRHDKDGLNIIATDPGNHRLVVFDAQLNPKFQISAQNPSLSEPKYFSQNRQGQLFVADQFNNAVRVFSREGEPITTFAQQHIKLPEGILVSRNRVWVADGGGGRVFLYQLSKNP